jgi:hypothetical protein
MIVPWARPRAMAPPIFPAPIIATFILLKIKSIATKIREKRRRTYYEKLKIKLL